MEYRTFGRTGWRASAIGLGTEYLLNQPPQVMERVIQMAADAGINYVDLLYSGPRFWNDFAPVFKSRRHKFMAAAHWGVGQEGEQLTNVREMDVCHHFFDQTLAHLGNDYADVGMLMMVDTEQLWDTWGQESLQRLARYKEQGRIGAIGMSSHKAAPTLKAVNSGLIDVLMYPVNLAAQTTAGNQAVLEACARQNVGVVAMKPYAGGAFFLPDQSVVLFWFRAGGSALQVSKPRPLTPSQCLSYVLSQRVATIVPGVKNADELAQTLHYLDATDTEKDFSAAVASVQPYPMGQCIYCNHCLPCPADIDIGRTIHLFDQAQAGVTRQMRAEYAALPARASDCTECGVCMERCPYEVDAPGKMRAAARLFESL